MRFLSDSASELLRIIIGLAATGVVVWICTHTRLYNALKAVFLIAWGALSFGIPLFALFEIYLPRGELLLGAVAVIAGAVAMIWPFIKFGWPSLRECLTSR